MALDFAVLKEDETSADFVSLKINEHDELMNLATRLKLPKLLRFEDYFEEAELNVAELPQLAEELAVISKSAPSIEIAEFSRNLGALVALAASRRQPISVIPD
jgi:hypothetical protein